MAINFSPTQRTPDRSAELYTAAYNQAAQRVARQRIADQQAGLQRSQMAQQQQQFAAQQMLAREGLSQRSRNQSALMNYYERQLKQQERLKGEEIQAGIDLQKQRSTDAMSQLDKEYGYRQRPVTLTHGGREYTGPQNTLPALISADAQRDVTATTQQNKRQDSGMGSRYESYMSMPLSALWKLQQDETAAAARNEYGAAAGAAGSAANTMRAFYATRIMALPPEQAVAELRSLSEADQALVFESLPEEYKKIYGPALAF